MSVEHRHNIGDKFKEAVQRHRREGEIIIGLYTRARMLLRHHGKTIPGIPGRSLIKEQEGISFQVSTPFFRETPGEEKPWGERDIERLFPIYVDWCEVGLEEQPNRLACLSVKNNGDHWCAYGSEIKGQSYDPRRKMADLTEGLELVDYVLKVFGN